MEYRIVRKYKYGKQEAKQLTGELIEMVLENENLDTDEVFRYRARFRVLECSRRRLMCQYIGYCVQIMPSVELTKCIWLNMDDIVTCHINQVDLLLKKDSENLFTMVPTKTPLHNWSGVLIDSKILSHLYVGNLVRVSCTLPHDNLICTYYFVITQLNPLRGIFSDIYNQDYGQEHLVGIETLISLNCITEVPTCFESNKKLKRYEKKFNEKFTITGCATITE